MALSEKQKTLVKISFGHIALSMDAVATTFYDRLFEVAPEVRPLFTTDIHEQGSKLMQMLATGVVSLDRLEQFAPILKDLGRRHAAYGVKPEQYDTVGDVLLWTLETVLKEDFTPDVRAAWAELYAFLAQTTIAGSKP